MINASHLSKSFGRHCVVDDVSFNIGEGCIFGLPGPSSQFWLFMLALIYVAVMIALGLLIKQTEWVDLWRSFLALFTFGVVFVLASIIKFRQTLE